MSDWITTPGYDYMSYYPLSECNSVVFMLHGLITDLTINPRKLIAHEYNEAFNAIAQKKAVIVVPDSGTQMIHNKPVHAWDVTNYFTNGRQVASIINLLQEAKTYYKDKLILCGGSLGATMAYRVAIELKRINKPWLINGLVLIDGLSPFNISLTDNEPDSHRYLRSKYHFKLLQHSYYDFESFDYVALGLSSKNDLIEWPTLCINSTNDRLIPDAHKNKFAQRINRYCHDFKHIKSGENHNTGEYGIKFMTDWVKKNL